MKVKQVVAALLVRDGHVLIAKRGPEDPLANKWEFPGDKVEVGESPEACLVRELQEEFGITVTCGDFFGSLPDTIEDEWIETVEKLNEMMDQYIHLRRQARDVFELRYEKTVDPDADRWELCSRVLSRRDVVERLSEPW